MIYLFERIPINISSPNSIASCYAKFKTPVNTSLKIEQIEKQKNEFYSFFQRLLEDKNAVASEQMLKPQMEYLQTTVDLIEIGDEAQFVFNQFYSPFLNDKNKLEFGKDNHSTLVIEYLMARYVFCLGGIRLLKKQVQTQMKYITKTDGFRTEEFREIIAVFKLAFLRLAKVYKHRTVILVT